MSNSILTIDMITRKALEILENNLVLTRNVNRQYDDSFAVEGAKIGSTLRIRLPDRALVTDGAALPYLTNRSTRFSDAAKLISG